MLSAADLRAALDVAAVAAGCRTMADVREGLMPAITRLCRADLCLHHQIDLGSLAEYNLVWPDDVLDLETVARYAQVQATHPFVRHFATTGDPDAVRISDLMAPRVWRSTPAYVDCFGALGVDDQLSTLLGVRDGCSHGLTVARRRRPFGDRERDLLALVRPLAAAAFRAALEDGTPYAAYRVGTVPAVVTLAGEALPPARGGLTAREWQVLRLLATGLTSRQVAGRLGISARTVDKHAEHVHTKLGATCRLDAVARGRELLATRW